MLVIPSEGDCTLFVPALEAARVEEGPFEIVPWAETEDPIRMVARVAGPTRRAAIGDHAWSAFLVGLQAEMPNTSWTVASTLTKALRMRKDPAEIESLREAAAAVDRVLARVPLEVRFSGRSEREIARDFAEMTVAEGHDTAWAPIVASGPNGASPHHEPGDRVVEEGDLVVCDFGGRVGGYHSDTTRTVAVGEPSARQAEVHSLVMAANEAAPCCGRTWSHLPGGRPGGPSGHRRGRLRESIHSSHRSWHRSRDTRAPIHRGGKRPGIGGGNDVLHRAGHLSAR